MPRRILFIIPSLKQGGAEHQTVQQVNALHEAGWPVFLCILYPELDIQHMLRLPSSNLLILNTKASVLSTKTAFASPHTIWRLRTYCKKNSITHIVANLPLGHWYGRLVKLSKPSIQLFNYHRSLQYDANPLNTIGKKIFNSVQIGLARITDNVSICISNAVKNNIASHFLLKNPVVIYNSVPDRFPLVVESVERKEKHRQLQIVLPGRFHTSKGQLFFLPVCKRLFGLLPGRVCFRFAGGGPLEQQVKKYIAENSLEENITVTGNLPNLELLKEMCSADIVVIPSLHEGLGNVAIESLMLGKTIVASDAGGLKEIITDGQNGYLFPAGDEAACISLLKKMVEEYPAHFLDPVQLRLDYQRRFSFAAHMTCLQNVISGGEDNVDFNRH